MKVFDLHCDALMKLHEKEASGFTDDQSLHVNAGRLAEGEIALQIFAIFIEPSLPSDRKFQAALEQIDLFHEEVIGKHKNMKKISDWEDIQSLKEGETGAILSLEGADAIGNDPVKLRTLYQLGVKSVGLTWNNANLCADGAGEPRNGGLTEFGFEVVRMNNDNRVWTDLSHLNVRSFWDAVEAASYPVASHSNSKAVCNHRRNLDDEQAKAVFAKNGIIGVVFTPPFINNQDHASISDLIRHIDHFCSIGGRNNVAFGSDFDGVTKLVRNLEHAGMYENLINELLKRYSEEEVKGFAYKNILRNLPGL